MNHTIRRCFNVLSPLVLFVPLAVRAADVRSMGLDKQVLYTQSALEQPTLATSPAFRFAVQVSASQANVTGATLTLPNGTSVALSYVSSDSEYALRADFATQAAMDVAYPAGTYTLSANTVHDGTKTFTYALPPTALPTAPHIGRHSGVDPAADFLLQWDALAGGRASDIVQAQVGPNKSPQPGQAGTLTGTSTSFNCPANSFGPSQSYSGSVRFFSVLRFDTATYPGAVLHMSFRSETDFNLQTSPVGGERPPDVAFYGLQKTVQYAQFDDGAPSLNAPAFAFSASVDSAKPGTILGASLRLPSGSTQNLSGDADNVEIYSQFNSRSALDVAYPVGNYTLNINTVNNGQKSFAFALPTTALPAGPHVANFADAQAVNPGGEFTLRWDPLPGGTVADLVTVDIRDSSDQTIFETANAGSPGALNGLATSATVSAGVLSPNKTYSANLKFYKVVLFDTTSWSPALGYLVFGSKTSFPVVTTDLVPLPTIQTPTLPTGVKGSSYTATLRATGGAVPYTFALAAGSTPLPDGVTLSGGGLLSGRPTVSGTFNLKVRVTDHAGQSSEKTIPLVVNAAAAGTPALAVSPASAPANYSGSVTVTITGLTPGQSVLLEKFQDGNANGAVDAGESLIQSLVLVDGQVVSIGGVRNANVPADEDGAADGQIRVGLPFGLVSESGRLVSPYVYRLTGLSAGFAEVRKTFSIADPSLAQKVGGTVLFGGAPVPRAGVVFLTSTGDGRFVGGVVADGSGRYSMSLPPGSYSVFAFKPGFVGDFDHAPSFTLGAGANANVDVSLVAAARTITGKIADAVDGSGLAGMQVFILGGGFAALAASDGDGNFSVNVTPRQWTFDSLNEAGLAALGYMGAGGDSGLTVDATSANVSGVVLSCVRATSLIYGKLRDPQGQPVAGIHLRAQPNRQGDARAVGFTDALGGFCLAVSPGDWRFDQDASRPLDPRYFVEVGQQTLSEGQAVRRDLLASPITSHVAGQVLKDDGSPLTNGAVMVWRMDGSGSAWVDLDAAGRYSLGLVAGSWHLQLENSDGSGVVSSGVDVRVVDGVDQTVNLVAFRANAFFVGSVKLASGEPLSDFQVQASMTRAGTNYNAGVNTDAAGNYRLGVFAGTWQINVNPNDLNNRGLFASAQVVSIAAGQTKTVDFVAMSASAGPIISAFLPPQSPQLQIQITGRPNQVYRVESTPALRGTATVWQNRGSVTTGGNGQTVFTESIAGSTQSFYRALQSP